METEVPTIKIELPIKQRFEIDIAVDKIIDAINDMELAQRWNTCAGIINAIALETEELTQAQRQFILDWLKRQLLKFEK